MYRHVLSALPHFTQQRRAVRIAHEVEVSVAAYLTTITLINFCLGVIVAAAMYALDVPNPILWGVMSAVLNYIPFLGPAVMAVVLTLVSVLTHPTLAAALIVPAVFILITSIEGYFVTPAAVGRHLTLNPLLIVVSLIFWFWMWGIIGGLLSVPLLVCLKVSLEHTLGPEVARIMG